MSYVARSQAIASSSTWEASLALAYECRGERTVLARQAHRGPLTVQKPLYPEGNAVCQSIVVHPPAGVAAGDRLTLDVAVSEHAHAQLTTPGAAKWYRSSGAPATQCLHFSVAEHGRLEWLPQETIVFDGAIAGFEVRIDLADSAIFLGWDIVCLGRRLSGERFATGSLRHDLLLSRGGARQWAERASISGGSTLLAKPVGLAGQNVFGTFLAAAQRVDDSLISACRDVSCEDGEIAVTRLPGVLVGRYRGGSAEAARGCFAALWARVRPELIGRAAVSPRIWNT
ncbi:MAG TPA: urease accessory protein UreD [Casimicrobiaceae bacterium]|nr:urease accessory protein UreD [Casimicrobiaceae bacterium]